MKRACWCSSVILKKRFNHLKGAKQNVSGISSRGGVRVTLFLCVVLISRMK